MSNTNLNELKEWLRIDGEEEDITLLSLLNVARAEIKVATGITKEDVENNVDAQELYKLIEKILVLNLYEDRTARENIHKGLVSLYMQLEGLICHECK